MKNTSREKLLFLKDGNLYLIKDNSLEPIGDPLHVENYSLIVDDRYFFHLSLDAPVRGKKARQIAKNFLNSIFPSDLVKGFGISRFGNTIIVSAFSSDFLKELKSKEAIFKNAGKITTPFLEILESKKVTYSDGEKTYLFEDGSIKHVEDGEDVLVWQDILGNIDFVKRNMELEGLRARDFGFGRYRGLIITLLIAYVFFLAGGVIRLKMAEKRCDSLRRSLNSLYTKVDIDPNSPDPYGKLLFLAKSPRLKGVGRSILRYMEVLSLSTPDGCYFRSFAFKKNYARCEGIAVSFSQVEEIKRKLENFSKDVVVENTKKTDEGVRFILRFSL